MLDYSVWNEPNLGHVGNLSAASYLNYYAACRFAIRQVNPNANVYYGELSTGEAAGTDACSWLIASTGGTTVATEGVAVHPYQFTVDPTLDMPGSADCQGIGKLDQWPANIARAGLRAAGGGTASLLVSEFGYCSARTPAPAGDPYVAGNAVAACRQNASGVASVLTPATHANWLVRAWTVASNAGATLFNYHTLAKRNQWEWRRGGGYIWESGILDNPTPAGVDPNAGYENDSYGASIRALRAVTETKSPDVTVDVAANVGERSATISGSVNPNGNNTTYRFEYGTTSSYGRTSDGRLSAGSGATAVSASLSELRPDTVYHYRLVATSRAGSSESQDRTFKTTTNDVDAATEAFDSDGTLYVATRTPSNAMFVTTRYADGSWHGPFQIAAPGTTFSAPALAFDRDRNLYVAAWGPDDTLYVTVRYANGSWNGPFQIAVNRAGVDGGSGVL